MPTDETGGLPSFNSAPKTSALPKPPAKPPSLADQFRLAETRTQEQHLQAQEFGLLPLSAQGSPYAPPRVIDPRAEEARLLRVGSMQVASAMEYLARGTYPYVIPVSPDVWLEPGYGFNTEARFPSVASGTGGGGGSRSFGGGRGGSGRNGYALGLINWRI